MWIQCLIGYFWGLTSFSFPAVQGAIFRAADSRTGCESSVHGAARIDPGSASDWTFRTLSGGHGHVRLRTQHRLIICLRWLAIPPHCVLYPPQVICRIPPCCIVDIAAAPGRIIVAIVFMYAVGVFVFVDFVS